MMGLRVERSVAQEAIKINEGTGLANRRGENRQHGHARIFRHTLATTYFG